MSFKNDLKELLRPFYIFNILLSLSYVILKRLPVTCNYLFQTDICEFDGRETEILFFLLIVIMIRTRKSGSVSMISYLSSSFIYTKIANLILWFNASFTLGIIYAQIFILGAFLLPQPTYSGPDNVIYFRSCQSLDEEISNKRVTWLVTFYTVWNPSCVNFAPLFAKLSNEYNLDNFKFGKIDVGRYPDVATKYKVNCGSFSKQLPTVVLFKNGEEYVRRPLTDSKGKVINFPFTEENLKTVFGLSNVYESCKSELQTKKHLKRE